MSHPASANGSPGGGGWRQQVAERIRRAFDLASASADSELDILERNPAALESAREDLRRTSPAEGRTLSDGFVAFLTAMKRAFVQLELMAPILAREEGDPAFPSLSRSTPAQLAVALRTFLRASGLDTTTIRKIGLFLIALTDQPGDGAGPVKYRQR